jgi:hypothetical protein
VQPSWLRDTKAGRILFVVVVLAVAFGITKGCANRDVEVEQDEAVEIARTQIDFTPNLTQVKFLKQGLRSRSTWFVSFAIREATGVFARCTVVEVSARTGAVGSIREGGRGDC